MKRYPLLIIASVLAAVATTGCQSNKFPQPNLEPIKEFLNIETGEEEIKPPVRMAVIWKDGVYEEAGQNPVRGLGGRVFFYDEDNRPTTADGELIVYGYDDSKENSDSNAADRKFVFRAERFQNHYSKTDLGDSYSVWVPWDEVGGVRKTVSLIPVFKTTDGKLIKAGQTLCMLPGAPPAVVENSEPELKLKSVRSFPGMESRIPSKSNAQSYIAQTSGIADKELFDQIGSRSPTVSFDKKIRTSTIRVPRSMAERMQQLPPQTLKPVEKEETVNYAAAMVKRIAEKKAELKKTEEEAEADEDNSFTGLGKFPTNRPVFGKPGTLQ